MEKIEIQLATKLGHDSRLYRIITQITEDLREKKYNDESIENFLISFVKETIKEV